jgi:hypothetical protein
MLWRALEAWREARGAGPGAADALLLSRVALVEALVALLALGAAALALGALRPRRRGHTLRLGDLAPGPRDAAPADRAPPDA